MKNKSSLSNVNANHVRAAKKWQQEHPEHINGVVLIWKNKAYEKHKF